MDFASGSFRDERRVVVVKGKMKNIQLVCPYCGARQYITDFEEYRLPNSRCDYSIKCPHCKRLYDPINNKIDHFEFNGAVFDSIIKENIQGNVNKIVAWIDRKIEDKHYQFYPENNRIQIHDIQIRNLKFKDEELEEVKEVFRLRGILFQPIKYDGEERVEYEFVFKRLNE